MIVLDTDVVSEMMRPAPEPAVLQWVDRQVAGDVWIASMTAAELLAGIALLPDGVRKRRFAARIGEMLVGLFRGRILPFDGAAAAEYARVLSARRRSGAPIDVADAGIAATCLAGGASGLVTRNGKDFAGLGLQVIDPWSEPGSA